MLWGEGPRGPILLFMTTICFFLRMPRVPSCGRHLTLPMLAIERFFPFPSCKRAIFPSSSVRAYDLNDSHAHDFMTLALVRQRPRIQNVTPTHHAHTTAERWKCKLLIDCAHPPAVSASDFPLRRGSERVVKPPWN